MQLADELWLENEAYEQAWLQLAINTFNRAGDCPMVWYALFMLEQ
jgi:hypothetical protein